MKRHVMKTSLIGGALASGLTNLQSMFNIKEDLSGVAHNALSEADVMLTQQRNALMADVEVKGRELSEAALARFGKIMILCSAMVTAGLLAVAAALIFGR